MEQLELLLREGRWESAIRERARRPPTPGSCGGSVGSLMRPRKSKRHTATADSGVRVAARSGRRHRPHELRPAPPGASRSHRSEAWERFDDAVAGLSRARTGLSVAAISHAFGVLSAAAWELADAVERTRRQPARAAGGA